MGEMLLAFLARLPNPFEWIARAGQNGGAMRVGLGIAAGVMVCFIVWKLLSSLYALSSPGARVALFLLSAVTGFAAAAAIVTTAPAWLG